jgi:hypothetical protein
MRRTAGKKHSCIIIAVSLNAKQQWFNYYEVIEARSR